MLIGLLMGNDTEMTPVCKDSSNLQKGFPFLVWANYYNS